MTRLKPQIVTARSIHHPERRLGCKAQHSHLRFIAGLYNPAFVRDWRAIALFLLFISHGCHAQMAPCSIRFKPHVYTTANHLGDLLQIADSAEISLQSHPTAGEWITKEKIMAWMPSVLSQCRWQGKTRIQVEQVTQSSGERLLEKATTALRNQLLSKYTRVDIKPLSTLKDSEYNIETFEIKMHITYPVAKRVCVWVIHDHKRVPVWFRVRAYARVLVASHNMNYHTLITSEAFSSQVRNIAGLRDKPAQMIPTRNWLTSSIKRNHILAANELSELPLVLQGQDVKVRVQNHGIAIAMNAIAMGDGYLGQSITVKNPLNQKTFVVVIRGPQEAEVTL